MTCILVLIHSIIVSAGFLFCCLVLPLRERSKLNTYYCIVFVIDFQGVYIKIFFKFHKFQPRFSVLVKYLTINE